MEKHYFKKINYWIITVAFIATLVFPCSILAQTNYSSSKLLQRTSATPTKKTLQYKVIFLYVRKHKLNTSNLWRQH
jgi:hypothetical protein